VKAVCDSRYSPSAIVTHNTSNPPVPATHVVERLSEVNVDGLKAIFIDELHFFGQYEATVAAWQAAGLKVTATSISSNSVGQDMVRGRLHSAAIRTEVVMLEGHCAVTGCILPATRTSRLVPVAASWVGGAESYAPHCELHHS
jgi:thymidine kinase